MSVTIKDSDPTPNKENSSNNEERKNNSTNVKDLEKGIKITESIEDKVEKVERLIKKDDYENLRSSTRTTLDSSHVFGEEGNETSQDKPRSESVSNAEFYPGTETLQYDFSADRKHFGLTDLPVTTLYMLKNGLVVIVLLMPDAFKFGGVWSSIGLVIFIAIMTSYFMVLLVKSAQKLYIENRVPMLNYMELIEQAMTCGPKFCQKNKKIMKATVNILLILTQSIKCCIFQILGAIVLEHVLAKYSSFKHWCLRMYIATVALPMLLLCMVLRIKVMRLHLQVMADVIIFLVICIEIGTNVYSIVKKAIPFSQLPHSNGFLGYTRFFGISFFILDGSTVALPMENNMRTPKYFRGILTIALPPAVLVAILIGLSGYWADTPVYKFGEDKLLSLKNYPLSIYCLLLLSLWVDFSSEFLVPFRMMWRQKKLRKIRYGKRQHECWERLCRAAYVLVITSFSLTFPYVLHMMSIFGGTLNVLLGIVFPSLIDGLIHWRVGKKRIGWNYIKNSTIISLGLLLCVVLTTANVYYIVKYGVKNFN